MMNCLFSFFTFICTTWNRPVSTLGVIHLLHTLSPSSFIYFFQSKMLMMKSYQSFRCVNSVHTPLRHVIKHSSIWSRRGRGDKKATNSATVKTMINEYKYHNLCMALNCSWNGQYLCHAPVAISASHPMLAFIRPSDTASRWNGCRKERKKPAHQLET